MADPLIEFGVESASGPLRVKSGNAMIKQKISARVIRDLVQPVASPGIVRCAAGSGSGLSANEKTSRSNRYRYLGLFNPDCAPLGSPLARLSARGMP